MQVPQVSDMRGGKLPFTLGRISQLIHSLHRREMNKEVLTGASTFR